VGLLFGRELLLGAVALATPPPLLLLLLLLLLPLLLLLFPLCDLPEEEDEGLPLLLLPLLLLPLLPGAVAFSCDSNISGSALAPPFSRLSLDDIAIIYHLTLDLL
jgi:hypothetical protein